tara:strand:- start:867 stop:1136 length:270 start_codon:yes stop_codon:yes gene_type:complete
METVKIISIIKNNNNLNDFENLSCPICYYSNNDKNNNLPNYIYDNNDNFIDDNKINQFIDLININKKKNKTKKLKTKNFTNKNNITKKK